MVVVVENATKPSRFPHFWQGAQSLAPATRSDLQEWSEPLVFLTFWLRNVLRTTTAYTFSTSELPKVVRTPGVFNILTSKCASRHNGVHFFDISTSKSGPDLVCFVHFDFEMCFAPQRRALFRHLNFQKWSGPGVLCTFWLRNVLRAPTACNFSSLIWPAGSATAVLASLLFDPPEPQILGKTQCFATFLPFAHLHLLSSDSFSSTLLSSNLSLLSASALLCFSSVHIVGSLTSKLPSMIICLMDHQIANKSLLWSPFVAGTAAASGCAHRCGDVETDAEGAGGFTKYDGKTWRFHR